MPIARFGHEPEQFLQETSNAKRKSQAGNIVVERTHHASDRTRTDGSETWKDRILCISFAGSDKR